MSDTLPPPTTSPGPDGRGLWTGVTPSDGDLTAGRRVRPATPAEPEGRSGPWGLIGTAALLVLLAVVSLPAFLMVTAILLSVFLHEVGHYVAAKRTGMKVTEFFIGFGPRLWSFRRGETTYGLKGIPAGAYVRIVGMHNLEEVDEVDEARTYRAKATWRRLVVVLAGPAMNLLIAFSLLVGIFAIAGKADEQNWTVGTVVEGSAAARAGLESGDRIVAVAGEPIGDWDDFGEVVQARRGEATEVVVERGGETIAVEMTVGERLTATGAAALPGLFEDDVVMAVDGERVPTYAALGALVEERAGETAEISVQRIVAVDDDGPVDAIVDVEVVLPEGLPAEGSTGYAGVGRDPGPRQRLNPLSAVGEAGQAFAGGVSDVVGAFAGVFSPAGLSDYAQRVFSTSPEEESGSIDQADPLPAQASRAQIEEDQSGRFISILGIIQIGSEAAESSWLEFVALIISMNLVLGLINLVPLLPLDGGHAVVALYEGVRSRLAGRPYRADMAKLLPLTYAVVLLFVFIGLSSLYLDIVDPVTLGP